MTRDQARSPLLGGIALALGGIALLLAIVHFYAGPFAPQPSFEDSVADTAVAIRDATVARLRGEEPPAVASPSSQRNIDDHLTLAVSVGGGLALILAVLGFARGESMRVTGGAGVLGAASVAFQFAVAALGAIVAAIIIAAILYHLDFDF